MIAAWERERERKKAFPPHKSVILGSFPVQNTGSLQNSCALNVFLQIKYFERLTPLFLTLGFSNSLSITTNGFIDLLGRPLELKLQLLQTRDTKCNQSLVIFFECQFLNRRKTCVYMSCCRFIASKSLGPHCLIAFSFAILFFQIILL